MALKINNLSMALSRVMSIEVSGSEHNFELPCADLFFSKFVDFGMHMELPLPPLTKIEGRQSLPRCITAKETLIQHQKRSA
jgi:hypothetical protein